jgi:hypothetical protein
VMLLAATEATSTSMAIDGRTASSPGGLGVVAHPWRDRMDTPAMPA